MKTFYLSCEMPIGTNWMSYKTRLTMSHIRMVIQMAAARDVCKFDDGYYHGLVHPVLIRDLLNDATFDDKIDVIYLDKSPEDQCDNIRFCGVKFLQTTTVNGIYIFGKDSDPLDLEQIYIGENGRLLE